MPPRFQRTSSIDSILTGENDAVEPEPFFVDDEIRQQSAEPVYLRDTESVLSSYSDQLSGKSRHNSLRSTTLEPLEEQETRESVCEECEPRRNIFSPMWSVGSSTDLFRGSPVHIGLKSSRSGSEVEKRESEEDLRNESPEGPRRRRSIQSEESEESDFEGNQQDSESDMNEKSSPNSSRRSSLIAVRQWFRSFFRIST